MGAIPGTRRNSVSATDFRAGPGSFKIQTLFLNYKIMSVHDSAKTNNHNRWKYNKKKIPTSFILGYIFQKFSI